MSERCRWIWVRRRGRWALAGVVAGLFAWAAWRFVAPPSFVSNRGRTDAAFVNDPDFYMMWTESDVDVCSPPSCISGFGVPVYVPVHGPSSVAIPLVLLAGLGALFAIVGPRARRPWEWLGVTVGAVTALAVVALPYGGAADGWDARLSALLTDVHLARADLAWWLLPVVFAAAGYAMRRLPWLVVARRWPWLLAGLTVGLIASVPWRFVAPPSFAPTASRRVTFAYVEPSEPPTALWTRRTPNGGDCEPGLCGFAVSDYSNSAGTAGWGPTAIVFALVGAALFAAVGPRARRPWAALGAITGVLTALAIVAVPHGAPPHEWWSRLRTAALEFRAADVDLLWWSVPVIFAAAGLLLGRMRRSS